MLGDINRGGGVLGERSSLPKAAAEHETNNFKYQFFLKLL